MCYWLCVMNVLWFAWQRRTFSLIITFLMICHCLDFFLLWECTLSKVQISASFDASPSKLKHVAQLFSSASGFIHQMFSCTFSVLLSRGLYLTSIFYRDDNVLVTSEDQIPIVEVEDSYSSSLMQDFLWFTKVDKQTDRKRDSKKIDRKKHSTINFDIYLRQLLTNCQPINIITMLLIKIKSGQNKSTFEYPSVKNT